MSAESQHNPLKTVHTVAAFSLVAGVAAVVILIFAALPAPPPAVAVVTMLGQVCLLLGMLALWLEFNRRQYKRDREIIAAIRLAERVNKPAGRTNGSKPSYDWETYTDAVNDLAELSTLGRENDPRDYPNQ